MARREWVLGWEARLLVVITAVFVVFGLASVYSASSVLLERGRQIGSARVLDQATGALAGALLLLIASRVNLDRVRALAWPVVLTTAGLLALLVLPFTHAVAPRINGARRWLDVGISIQVSEIAKLAVVIWTAMLCAKKGKEVKRLSRGALPVLTIVVPLAALILLEPDLSAAVAVLFLAVVILFVAGARIGHFILLGLVALPLLWARIERLQYQVLRLAAFSDPGAAGPVDRYQLDQSLIGVGSGRLIGVGFGQGQQKVGFLPYPYSDFMFATIAEEWGFVGVAFIGSLFLAFVLIAIHIARGASDPFRQYLGLGCAAMVGVDAFLHMAVAVGVAPTTGLPLPFISYGRSSLVMSLIATGLIINIGTQRRQVVSA